MNSPRGFLDKPGRPGPFGAILDEYARAAEDLCRVVEAIPFEGFADTRESSDPDTVSIHEICRHTIRAAYGYSNDIRDVRKMPKDEKGTLSTDLEKPGELRGCLAAALRHTEATLEGLYGADGETVMGLQFQARWGQTYDPETILEHGIVHLLRHRRQIERWMAV